jgi:hypothetical protein
MRKMVCLIKPNYQLKPLKRAMPTNVRRFAPAIAAHHPL